MKRSLRIIEWGLLLWAFFILYLYGKQFPLNSYLLFSIFPTSLQLPTLSLFLFYIKGLFLFLGILMGSYGYGTLATQPLKIKWFSSLEKTVFSLAVGHGITALLVFALAALHWLYPPILISLWILGVLLFCTILMALSDSNSLIQSSQEIFKYLLGNEHPLWMRFFIWIFLILSFAMALVPELFYDALVYHLGAPNLYLQEKGIVRIPGVLSKVPMIWQMLYLFGLALQDEMIPKLIHWCNALLILLALGTFAKRFQFPKSGLFAGLLFLSIPMVQMNLWTSGIDIGGALFSGLGLYALLCRINRTPEEPSLGWTCLTALFAALSFSSKYQGGFTALILFFILACALLRSGPKNIKTLLQECSIFILLFSIFILPWLFKNLWDTGNPLFPFLSSFFKTIGLQKGELDPQQWIGFINENRRFITSSWKELWTLPWKLTFKDSNQSSLSFVGPLFLALLPFNFLLIREWKKTNLQYLFLFVLLFFIFSFQSTHLTRYHLQGYPVLCLVYGISLSRFWEKNRPLFKTFLIFPICFLLLENLQVAAFIIQNSYKPWDVLLGKESRETYRSYSHPGLNPYPANQMFRWMEKNIDSTSRTLFLGDSKPFDLKLPYLYTDVHGQNPIIAWTRESRSSEELKRKLQEAGITHFLVNLEEARRTYSYKMLKWDSLNLIKLDDFWKQYVEETHRETIPEKYFPQGGVLLLYAIKKEQRDLKEIPPMNPLVLLEKIK